MLQSSIYQFFQVHRKAGFAESRLAICSIYEAIIYPSFHQVRFVKAVQSGLADVQNGLLIADSDLDDVL